VTSIPTSFFIDRDGKIKLAALGVVPLEEAKAIIKSGQG
jgi:peroxiredoxin